MDAGNAADGMGCAVNHRQWCRVRSVGVELVGERIEGQQRSLGGQSCNEGSLQRAPADHRDLPYIVVQNIGEVVYSVHGQSRGTEQVGRARRIDRRVRVARVAIHDSDMRSVIGQECLVRHRVDGDIVEVLVCYAGEVRRPGRLIDGVESVFRFPIDCARGGVESQLEGADGAQSAHGQAVIGQGVGIHLGQMPAADGEYLVESGVDGGGLSAHAGGSLLRNDGKHASRKHADARQRHVEIAGNSVAANVQIALPRAIQPGQEVVLDGAALSCRQMRGAVECGGCAGACGAIAALIRPIEILHARGRRQVGEVERCAAVIGQGEGQLRKRDTLIPLPRLGTDCRRTEVQRCGRCHQDRLGHRKHRVGAEGEVLCSTIAGDREDGGLSAGEASRRRIVDFDGAASVCRNGGADRAGSSRTEAEVGCAGGAHDGSNRQRRAAGVFDCHQSWSRDAGLDVANRQQSADRENGLRGACAVERDRGQRAVAKGKRVREWARSGRLKVDGQRAGTAGIERVRARLRAGGGAIEEKISAQDRGSRGEVARGVADVGQGKTLRIVGRIQRPHRRGCIKGDLRGFCAKGKFLH